MNIFIIRALFCWVFFWQFFPLRTFLRVPTLYKPSPPSLNLNINSFYYPFHEPILPIILSSIIPSLSSSSSQPSPSTISTPNAHWPLILLFELFVDFSLCTYFLISNEYEFIEWLQMLFLFYCFWEELSFLPWSLNCFHNFRLFRIFSFSE